MSKRVRTQVQYPNLPSEVSLPDEIWVSIILRVSKQYTTIDWIRMISRYFSSLFERIIMPMVSSIGQRQAEKMNSNQVLIKFTGLESMILCDNHKWYITEKTFRSLTKLRTLDINVCGRKLPYSFLGSQIKELRLRETIRMLNRGDDVLKHFTCLEKLSIQTCLTISDNSLSLITSLRTLFLDGTTYLTNNSISRLVNLTSLDLKPIPYKSTIDSSSLSCLTNLTTLSMESNILRDPFHFSSLSKNLRQLSLSGGSGFKLDSGLSYLTSLTELNLEVKQYDPRVRQFTGEGFPSLTQLTSLNLSGQFTGLKGSNFCTLSPSLKKLILYDNYLLEDDDLAQMKNLEDISLERDSTLSINALLNKPNLKKLRLFNCDRFTNAEHFTDIQPLESYSYYNYDEIYHHAFT